MQLQGCYADLMQRIWRYLIVCGYILFSFSSQVYAESDHKLFDKILKQHVRDGFVNYPAIVEDNTFDQYLNEIAKPLTSESRDEQLAFWINAYNAFAIRGILNGGSPSTFFGRIGYFKNSNYTIGGRRLSLHDLEHKIIIPFDEPRIHFAINCASVSCPKLQSHAFIAKDLEDQLERAAYEFINDPTRNRFDRQKKVAYLSKIFSWFKKDFEKQAGSIQTYIASYVADSTLAQELHNQRYTVKFLHYDWNLNGVSVAQ